MPLLIAKCTGRNNIGWGVGTAVTPSDEVLGSALKLHGLPARQPMAGHEIFRPTVPHWQAAVIAAELLTASSHGSRMHDRIRHLKTPIQMKSHMSFGSEAGTEDYPHR